MKTNTRIAFAALLSAAGAVLTAFAAEFNGGPTEAPVDPAAPAEPPATTKKPRKNSATTAPAETAPETAAEPEPEEKKEEPAPTVDNPKYEEHRKLIAPLVQGEESTAELRAQVKEIVKKYSPDGGLKVMPVKHHAAFEKDIAALSY